MAYTKEQLTAQRETLKKHLDALDQELAGGGERNDGGDVTASVEKRDRDAELWDRLSPVEKMELFLNNRERWDQIKEAYESEGMRKLLGRK